MRLTASLAAAALVAGLAAPGFAQSTTPTQNGVTTQPGAAQPNGNPPIVTTDPNTTTPGKAAPGTAAPGQFAAPLNGNAAPGGTSADNNATVDTTGAKPGAQPAKGANSFTEEQAKGRLADNGFSNISGLKLDGTGVWRGTATKAGKAGDVWLDYQGNYGQP